MPPKTLLTADLHLSDNTRDAYRWEIFPWLIKQIELHKIERAILLGDITEYKDGHSAYLVNRIVDTLVELGGYCDVVILRGNHDGLTPDCPFFKFTGELKHITWISSPLRIGRELFLPHTDNYKQDWANINFDADTFFCHQTFIGAAAESGSQLAGVPLDIIPPNIRVFSGDIHKPQQLGSVTYVGAPYTIRFGDDYDPRIIILQGKKATSIPVPGVRKRLLNITSPAQLKPDVANPGDLVKVRVHLDTTKDSWDIWRAEIADILKQNKWKSCGILPVDERLISRVKPQTSPTITDKDLMHEFADRQGLNEIRLKIGMEFVDEGN